MRMDKLSTRASPTITGSSTLHVMTNAPPMYMMSGISNLITVPVDNLQNFLNFGITMCSSSWFVSRLCFQTTTSFFGTTIPFGPMVEPPEPPEPPEAAEAPVPPADGWGIRASWLVLAPLVEPPELEDFGISALAPSMTYC